MFGHPSLRLLLSLKLRGSLRMQVRRLRRPSSWIFLALGALLMFGWMGSLLLGSRGAPPPNVAPRILELGVDLGLFALLVLTVVGAFQHRGLYLPKEEIELLFSAPLARTQLVRYRLATSLFRSLFAALIFGLLAARRLPHAGFAFAGTTVVMLTVPVLGQLLALLLGESENRLARLARRLPLKLISVLLGAGIGLAVVYLISTEADEVPVLLSERGGWLAQLSEHPLVRGALLPVRPWGRMLTATSAGEFLPWFCVAAGAWIVLYELCTRLAVDYRELSLSTSADVARRIQLARRGGWSASQSGSPRGAAGRGTPWLFGRGGFGAIAWLELTSMLRRARGTLILSLFVVALLVVLSSTLGRDEGGDSEANLRARLMVGSLLISVLGTVYLCAGLRFDFRGRLEQMELVKAWPLAPWRVFLATILPEVALVALLISAAVLGRAAWIGAFDPAVLGLVLFQPLVVLTWVALDNAVFLHSPVRYVPGQESALQHMGRSLVLLLLRAVLLALVAVAAVGPAVAVGFLLRLALGLPKELSVAVAVGVAWVGMLAVDGGLVWLGGRMLARFDVARDRG